MTREYIAKVIFAVADELGVSLDELFEISPQDKESEQKKEHVENKILEITKKKLLAWSMMEEEWKEEKV